MNYLLRHIPDNLWLRARELSLEQNETMRVILIRGLKEYVIRTPRMHFSQLAAEIPPEEQEKAQAMAKDALEGMKVGLSKTIE